MTCFYAHVLPEHTGSAMDLLGRMMRPALRQDDFDTEKGVILEEIAMYKDNPFWVLYEETVDRFYAPHPLRPPRARHERDRHGPPRATQMHGLLSNRALLGRQHRRGPRGQDRFRRCRQADRIAVRLVAAVRRGRATSRTPTMPSAAISRLRRRAKVSRYVPDRRSRPAPSIEDDRRYAAMLLMQILGASDNSRLHWSIIETGIAEEARRSTRDDGVGEYLIFASGDPATCRRDLVACIQKESSTRSSARSPRGRS
jgi:hypothetical protein